MVPSPSPTQVEVPSLAIAGRLPPRSTVDVTLFVARSMRVTVPPVDATQTNLDRVARAVGRANRMDSASTAPSLGSGW